MSYDLNIVEEELKNKIAEDYFKNFDSTQIIEQIDFCIARKIQNKDAKNFESKEFEAEYYLWAEAKKGKNHNITNLLFSLFLQSERAEFSINICLQLFWELSTLRKSHSCLTTK